MYGAVIGDIVGSKYEFNNVLTKDFEFVSKGCSITDDSLMTFAVAKAIIRCREGEADFKSLLIQEMQEMGRRFPYPQGGYGGRFNEWIHSDNPIPYKSFGNGSAMRVSPCGLIAVTVEEAMEFAKESAEVTHNHPEGIKGAKAVAAAIFLAKSGHQKEEIRKYINDNFYKLDKTLDEIRETYTFNETCQETVPQAIVAFLESESFEDAVRNAISIGGDSDTIGAITGSIAWSHYRFGVPDKYSNKKENRIWTQTCEDIINNYNIDSFLADEFLELIDEFDILRMKREGTYARTGFCSPILK